MTQSRLLEELRQLECHFTWELNKEDINITDLLNRLEQHVELNHRGLEGLAHTYNSLAFVKYLLGSPKEALTKLEESVALTKQCHENNCDKWLIVTYGNLAWVQYHMECYTECERYLGKLRDIADKFPASAYAIHHEVLGEKAWALFKFSRKYYDRAKECFKMALELEPDNTHWNTGYALVLHRTETWSSSSDDSAAVKQLQQAIDKNADNDELRVLLALRLARLNEYDKAERLVEEALEHSPSAPYVIRYVGKFFRDHGSVDRSLALLKRALEHMSNSGFIHHQLALCYKRKKISLQRNESRLSPSTSMEVQKLRHQCIYHLEQASTLKTCFNLAMIELAVQYGEDEQLDRAEDLFQETLRVAKEKNEYLQKTYFHYGEFQQYRKRHLVSAIRLYMESLKIDHDTVDGKKSANNLKKIADRCLTRCPEDGKAWAILGFIHKAKGENRRALECYEKALQYTHSDKYLSVLRDLEQSLQ
ncbi:interferon-induced protein with tetratricopeptide repeats 5-like [Brachyhypopomus gauderio]|uniref:interferon-induced protein with tetratricopeptide repeats 5-like n=1 Tax=Brachyhypopomus gauderio TaxID=698409 RepID=UPI004041210D